MVITYDPAKRLAALRERDLDFESAAELFSGVTFEFEDTRKDYGERRVICIGLLSGRMVMVCYVQRGLSRHVFSMRKCNAREIKRYKTFLDHAG